MIGLCDAQLSASDFPHGYDFDPEQVGSQKTFCDTYLILSNDANKVWGNGTYLETSIFSVIT